MKETEITHNEQVIVCAITYLKTDAGHADLALATDPYSKKIRDMPLRIICAWIWPKMP